MRHSTANSVGGPIAASSSSSSLLACSRVGVLVAVVVDGPTNAAVAHRKASQCAVAAPSSPALMTSAQGAQFSCPGRTLIS